MTNALPTLAQSQRHERFETLLGCRTTQLPPRVGGANVVKTGKTPVLEAAEWRRLIGAISTETVRDLRDQALSASLGYFFARSVAEGGRWVGHAGVLLGGLAKGSDCAAGGMAVEGHMTRPFCKCFTAKTGKRGKNPGELETV